MSEVLDEKKSDGKDLRLVDGGLRTLVNPSRLIDWVGDVVKKGIEECPRKQVGFIVVAFLVFVLCLPNVLGGGLYGLIATLAAIIALICAMYFLSKTDHSVSKMASKEDVSSNHGKPKWLREMVKLPLPQKKLQLLERKAHSIRQIAKDVYFDLLAKRKRTSQINKDVIRTNIFLPDNRDVESGEVCRLQIPERLHAGMENRKELGIRFRTREGVTGQVYSEQRPIGTCRKTKSGNRWKRISLLGLEHVDPAGFPLNQEQISLIDKKLQWIISIPIIVDRNGEKHTFGVFNIDGLDEMLEPNEMQTLYNAINDHVCEIAKLLEDLPHCLVSISVDAVEI